MTTQPSVIEYYIDIEANSSSKYLYFFVMLISALFTTSMGFFVSSSVKTWVKNTFSFLPPDVLTVVVGILMILVVFITFGLAIGSEWYMKSAVSTAIGKYESEGYAVISASFVTTALIVSYILYSSDDLARGGLDLGILKELGIAVLIALIVVAVVEAYEKNGNKYTVLFSSFIALPLIVVGLGTVNYKVDAIGGSNFYIKGKVEELSRSDSGYKNRMTARDDAKKDKKRYEETMKDKIASLELTKMSIINGTQSIINKASITLNSNLENQIKRSNVKAYNTRTLATKKVNAIANKSAQTDNKIRDIDLAIKRVTDKYEKLIRKATLRADTRAYELLTYEETQKDKFHKDSTDYRKYVKYFTYIWGLLLVWVLMKYQANVYLFAPDGATTDFEGTVEDFESKYKRAKDGARDEIDIKTNKSSPVPGPTKKKKEPVDLDSFYQKVLTLSLEEGVYAGQYLVKLSNSKIAKLLKGEMTAAQVNNASKELMAYKDRYALEYLEDNSIVFLSIPN